MKDDLSSLYAYSEWANARVLSALRALPEGDYTREMGGGWPSLRATFVHLASATNAWAKRFTGTDVTKLHTEEELPDLESAIALLAAAEAELSAFVAGLSEEQRDRTFTWKNLKGEPKSAPFWVVLRHVVNHASYHRGQISSMVRRLGGKPLPTDMVLWGIEMQSA